MAELTRRGFLEGAGIVGLATLGMGLAGCAASKTADDDTKAVAAVEGSGDAAAEAAPAAASNLPEWDEEHEIVVVGAGGGLVAALYAQQQGADVLLIEKMDHAGGLWAFSGGNGTIGGGNCEQAKYGIEDSVDAFYRAEMCSTFYKANPVVMRALCEAAPEYVQWQADLDGWAWSEPSKGSTGTDGVLRAMGADITNFPEDWGITKAGGGAWTTCWIKNFEAAGNQVRVNTKMTKLWRDGEDGPVVGIEAETPSGTVNIKATKAVIVATGGYTDNLSLLAITDPRFLDEDVTGDGAFYGQESTGDGHIACMELGAYMRGGFTAFPYPSLGTKKYKAGMNRSGKSEVKVWNDSIAIDASTGLRFALEGDGDFQATGGRGSMNEDPNRAFTIEYLGVDHPRRVWFIFDQAGIDRLREESGSDTLFNTEELQNPDPNSGVALEPDFVKFDDTLEGLASQIGAPVDAFIGQIDRYNSDIEAGNPDEWGREGDNATIAEGPFYAVRYTCVLHTCRDGICVNSKCQVVDGSRIGELDKTTYYTVDDYPTIPHLYVSGECGDFLHNRPTHSSLGMYATSNLIAAKNALAETPVQA